MKKNLNISIRFIVYIAGLFVVALGIRLSIVAGLGLSAGVILAKSLTQLFGLNIAFWMFAVSFFTAVPQIFILRKDFKIISLLQLVFAFIFSSFIAIVDPLVNWWIPNGYFVRFIQMLVSIMLMSLGILFVVKARLIAMPPECLILAVLQKVRGTLGKFRTIYDCATLVLGIILSLIPAVLAGHFNLFTYLDSAGIREGTVLSAVMVGVFVGIFDKLIGKSIVKLTAIGSANQTTDTIKV